MIDSDLRTFLEGGLGIHIGTRTARLEPNGARAVAVKVEDDGLHLTIYVTEAASQRVLPDLKSNGAAAVVFARPVDDRACQIKGIFVDVRPGADGTGSSSWGLGWCACWSVWLPWRPLIAGHRRAGRSACSRGSSSLPS